MKGCKVRGASWRKKNYLLAAKQFFLGFFFIVNFRNVVTFCISRHKKQNTALFPCLSLILTSLTFPRPDIITLRDPASILMICSSNLLQ